MEACDSRVQLFVKLAELCALGHGLPCHEVGSLHQQEATLDSKLQAGGGLVDAVVDAVVDGSVRGCNKNKNDPAP